MSADFGCLAQFHDFCESLSRAGEKFCRRCGAELVLDLDQRPRIFVPTYDGGDDEPEAAR